jgi:hypothetical protein
MFPTFLSLGMSPMLLHRQILSEPKMNRGKRDGKGRPSDDPQSWWHWGTLYSSALYMN